MPAFIAQRLVVVASTWSTLSNHVVQGLSSASTARLSVLHPAGLQSAASNISLHTERRPKAESIVPNDLWAVHDLLLAGYGAIFMKDGSAGKQEVKDATMEFALLLPKLHPHEPCRTALATALYGSGQVGEASLKAAARASWECLPGGLADADFEDPFTEGMVDDSNAAFKARMTRLLDVSLLGACKESRWPRTCSYWTSLHAMAYRADGQQMAGAFLKAVVPVLAGGATLCGGCTLHLRSLLKDVLSQNVLDDLGETF